MNYLNGNILAVVSVFALIGEFNGAFASEVGEASAAPARRGCEYAPLSQPNDRALFQSLCGRHLSAQEYASLSSVLARLDPTQEARAAAERGDFRLAAYAIGGVPRPGRQRNWAVSGVSCELLNDADISILFLYADAIEGEKHSEFIRRISSFATSYNIALVGQSDFPALRKCTQM